jgi:uncharacterized protein YcfL
MKKMLVLPLSLTLFVLACGGAKALRSVTDDLQSTVREYNDLLKQNELDKAELFTVESVREEFEARAKAAKNVKVTDYRILRTDFETLKGEEMVEVKFDYYIPPSATLRTVLDEQKWSFVYAKDEKRKVWRLMSPLPEFK